jgi:hypothetical protein
MSKKHATLDSASFGIMVDAAKELDDKEEENKRRDREAGRRNEIDDLPPGHPLKLMMEESKRKFEAAQQATQERESTIKTAKKLSPQKQAQQQQQAEGEHKERKAVAKKYNDAVMNVLAGIDKLRGIAAEASSAFVGFPGPRVKLTRASRAASAAGHALHESLINADERG